MTFEWSDWGLPLGVFALGLLIGLVAVLRLRHRDAAVEAEGREQDLLQAHRAAVEALKALELDREKLDPTDYAREHEALLARGAAALRELEAFRAGRTSAPPPVQPPPPRGMAPEWKGALTALSVVAVLFVLVQFVRADTVPRRDGASMTGRQDLGAPAAGESSWAQVRAQLDAGIAAAPEDVHLLNEATQASLSAGDLQAAMEYNQRAFTIDPENADATAYKALLAAMVGLHDRAIEGLDEVLAKHPDHARAVTYKGLLLLEMRRHHEAVEALEKAVALQPTLAPLREQLERARTLAAAEVVLAGTATLDPARAGALTGRETVYVSVRDPAGGPPLAAVRLPPGPFPLAFEVTTADAIAMGGAARPFPETLALTVRIDTDGDPTTRDGEPSAEMAAVARGTAHLELELR